MSVKSIYCINVPHVISEIIDGEAIILNFESGSYYSLNESGMAVWTCIQEGRTRDEILAHLRQRYADVGADAEIDLSAILKVLESEQLIVPTDAAVASQQSRYDGAALPYVKPGLEKFTDLEELLLLDPIHDVDESGWPHNSP